MWICGTSAVSLSLWALDSSIRGLRILKEIKCVILFFHHLAMSSYDLAVLSKACGEMAFRPPEAWLNEYLEAVKKLLDDFQQGQLADMFWGLSRMQVQARHQRWTSKFLQVRVVCLLHTHSQPIGGTYINPPSSLLLLFLQASLQKMEGIRTSDLVTLASTVHAMNMEPDKVGGTLNVLKHSCMPCTFI